jgi:uncharacterized membrane protein
MMAQRLRNYLIAGFLIVLPVGVTVFVLLALFRFLDSLLGPIFRALGVTIPGLGLVSGVVLIVFTGFMASNVLGRRIVGAFDKLMLKIPFARTIYGAVKQFSDTILMQNRSAFREAVLVEWPREGFYSVGFVTGETRGEVQAKTTERVVNVFIVTTPNPTTGFLCLVPESKLTRLEMSVEDALKLVVSAGIVTPPYPGQDATALARDRFE